MEKEEAAACFIEGSGFGETHDFGFASFCTKSSFSLEDFGFESL